MRAIVSDTRRRVVYSTAGGASCAGCGWPLGDCRCAKDLDEPVPERIVARLRVEKKGRGGKTVTIVEGLPRNARFLDGLAQDLKKACGTGGTVTERAIELQGDRRERVREILSKKGIAVKG
jgi:translation initiation factor 1